MKNLLLLITFVTVSVAAIAGGGGGIGTPTSPAPACSGNAPAGNTCAQATPICDLNGYCGSTASTYTANYWSQLNSTFCGSIENNSFLSFVASSSSISFNVWLTSSSDGTGIQIMVFSTAQPCSGAVTSYTCWNPGTATAGPTLVTANGLTPGNTYYIMIDGNAGDVCDYIIGANSGISTPVSVTASATTICAGESVTLTASGGGGTYTWTADPALSSTSGTTVTATPPGPGTYTYTANSPITGSLCTGSSNASATTTITVNPCGCSITAGNSGPVCPGGTFGLTATPVPAGSGYSWTGPNGYTSTAQNPSGLTAPTTPGSYTYTVSSTQNGIACTSTTTVVVTDPTVNAGPDQSVCAGTAVTLTGTPPSPSTVLTWDNGVSDGVAFTPTATTTYTLTGVTNGCTGTDQVTVTINPLPTVNAGNDLTICSGEQIVLSATPVAPVTYTWDNGVTNGVPHTPSASGTYTVTATTSAGCTATDQMQLTVSPTPVVAFTPSVTTGCVPLEVTYTNTNPGNHSYVWDLGNGSNSTNAASANTIYTAEGCYNVTLTATSADGCVGQLSIPSVVCTFANPVAEFVPNPGALTLMDVHTTMNNNSTGASTYLWDFGDGETSSLFAPTHAFPGDDPGSYQISLIAITEHGCRDTAKVNIQVEDILIYYVPNSFTPDDDEHNPVFKPIFTAGFDPMDYKMVIFNRWGEMVFESNDADYGWDGTYTASPGIVMDGTYTWKIEFKTTRSDERKMIVGSVTIIR